MVSFLPLSLSGRALAAEAREEPRNREYLQSSLEGIAEHYIGASISLLGVVLDPSLPLAA